MSETDPADARARLAYELTMRSLDRQSSVLSELRTRASIILSATGIVASLIGPDALQDPGTPLWLVVPALVALVFGLVASIAVLLPAHDKGKLADPDAPRWKRQKGRRRWKLTLTAPELERATTGATEHEMLQSIVSALTPARRVNYRTLELRSWSFNAACVLLVVQLMLWTSILAYAR